MIPPSIASNETALNIYEECMEADKIAYQKIVELLEVSRTSEFEGFKDAKSRARKAAQEDARFVLPNSCDTQLVMTMNARSLMNFFRLRCCERAQWEIRAVANEMLRLVREVAPNLFSNAGPPCVNGRCTEGKMSCGKSKREKGKIILRGAGSEEFKKIDREANARRDKFLNERNPEIHIVHIEYQNTEI